MKSQKAIVGILTAILVVNIIGVTLVTIESKKQTEIALQTAELEAIQAQLIGYEMELLYAQSPDGSLKYMIAREADNRLKNIKVVRRKLGLSAWFHNMDGVTFETGTDSQTGYMEEYITEKYN